MHTTEITSEILNNSVIAVPPLARNPDLTVNADENRKIVDHIEKGGISTLLYGGNANFYHLRPSEFEPLIGTLADIAGEDTLVIPSAGPAYGTQMDQAKILAQSKFPTAMVLPAEGIMTDAGLLTGFRHFVEAISRPAVLYIKREGYITPRGAAQLVNDDLVSFIKYAIVREDTAQDEFLDELVQQVDPSKIVSGIGEQPAVTHLTQFNLTGFTAGCVCVRPDLSQELLGVIKAGKLDRAADIQAIFKPLEDLRNGINPIRVLHAAVQLADIAETGPQMPLLCGLNDEESAQVKEAAKNLLSA
ncbi:MAG: dihydrodipicolinate synthase family protein [Verrucomicrobiales bacterium]|mgnify:CR=1 FL=1|nr:dihydrodipicolinate synthase family protein [Verrucomicrobiales bacterium]|tara:strand:+ start:744 stop:1652 length:909 start_codon:yes stop_codon:yes gene_type:complete